MAKLHGPFASAGSANLRILRMFVLFKALYFPRWICTIHLVLVIVPVPIIRLFDNMRTVERTFHCPLRSVPARENSTAQRYERWAVRDCHIHAY